MRPAFPIIMKATFVLATLGGAADHAEPAWACLRADHAEALGLAQRVLTSEAECLLEPLMAEPDTITTMGPRRALVSQDLYAYLLDHPDVTVQLLWAFGLDRSTVTMIDATHFRIDDRHGADGTVTVLSRAGDRRIFLIDGRHTSAVFPTVHARTAVVVTWHAVTAEGRAAVDTTLTSYTRFDRSLVSRLLTALKPVATWAVRRSLEHEFSLPHRLGELLAHDPPEAARRIRALSQLPTDVRHDLGALISAMPPSRPLATAP